MTNRIFILTTGCVFILLAAVGVWVTVQRNTQVDSVDKETVLPRNYERMARPPQDAEVDPVKKIRLTHQDIVNMRPAQWTERFESMHRNVAAEITEEIVLLAGELQSELEAGLDPQSEDAQAYTETMLTLLSEGALEISQ